MKEYQVENVAMATKEPLSPDFRGWMFREWPYFIRSHEP